MALQGGIDTLTHRRIVGWAWESDAPDVPVPLVMTAGSRIIGRCAADLFREDLAIEGMALGLVGFALDLPAGALSPRESYAISVRREGCETHLPGSPRVLARAMRLVR